MGTKQADSDLLGQVKAHIQNGTYVLMKHAIQRKDERSVTLFDILRVLEYGRHERANGNNCCN